MTYEQFSAVTFFEFLDLTGEGGLGDIQHFRCPREAAVRSYGMERAQMGMRYWHNLFEAFVLSI